MRLPFDQNLSPKLIERLTDLFPDSNHVRNISLHETDDSKIWEYARDNGLAIVSKDEDFHQFSFSMGHHPR